MGGKTDDSSSDYEPPSLVIDDSPLPKNQRNKRRKSSRKKKKKDENIRFSMPKKCYISPKKKTKKRKQRLRKPRESSPSSSSSYTCSSSSSSSSSDGSATPTLSSFDYMTESGDESSSEDHGYEGPNRRRRRWQREREASIERHKREIAMGKRGVSQQSAVRCLGSK